MSLVIHNISKRYGDRNILVNINISVNNNARILLIGPNGSGKTTLLKIIAGLIKPDAGKVDCKPPRLYIPESVPRISLFNAFRICKIVSKECNESTLRILAERLGVGGLIRRELGLVSSGEARKLFVAAILSAVQENGIKCLLIDEPFANLDAASRRKVFDLLTEYAKLNFPSILVIASHIIEPFMLNNINLVMAIYNGKLLVMKATDLAKALENLYVGITSSRQCTSIDGVAVVIDDLCYLFKKKKEEGFFPITSDPYYIYAYLVAVRVRGHEY